tara:strand:- start:95 stop:694 length:600 start_codon:yes stop_codon:yes gene_type:complete
MKTIAVTQRVDNYPEINETRDCLDNRLVEWLYKCGVVSFPIPNILGLEDSDENLSNWLKKINPDGIVLSGGNDLGKIESRDKLELKLIDYAKLNKLPLLGICRGMQIIGKWAGTEIKEVKNHVKIRHKIHGLINGEVNSFHNFALSECPKNFNIIAKSSDGEIEGIKHSTLPWEGWMWHPEREKKFDPKHIERFKNFIS